MRFLGVIPARYQSTRFPGKALAEIGGKTLIQWVWERTLRSRKLDQAVVATDDKRIAEAVAAFGGKAMMTRDDHQSGTDRVAEVAQRIESDCYINIQGDEPLIAFETIDALCVKLEETPQAEVVTARVPLEEESEARNPNINKVVVDHSGRALYFSRSPIPYPRNRPTVFFKHLGIYGYRRSFLLRLGTLRPSQLERTEALEQLRLLENGISIYVVDSKADSIGVDTPEDLERVRALLQNGAK